jgi:tape measure domain-containing protein
MPNVGYATLSIIPDMKGFREKLNTEVGEASVGAGREGGSGLGGAMLGTLGGLGLGVAISKAFDITKSVFDFDNGIQQATTGLTALLHSAPAANALITQLQNLAQASSLLDTGSAVKLGQVLVGMGDPVKNVTADMTALADASAGVGGTPETLDALSRAWGQMAAKGKIQSDEILQMTEQGVPALQLLAKAYGVPTGEMSKMISKGTVLSSDALPKLRAEMEKSFGGADAAAGANSIGGAFDRIKEAAISLAGSAAMPLIKALTPIIAGLADELGSPKVQAFVNSVGPKLKSLLSGFGGAGGEISKLGPSFSMVVTAAAGLWTTLQPIVSQIFDKLRTDILPNLIPLLQKTFTAIANALTTIGVVVGQLWKLFGPSILATIDVVFKTLVKLVSDAFDILEGVFEVIQGLFTGDWSLLWQGVKDIFAGAWHFMTDWLTGELQLWGQAFSAVWAFIKGLFSGVADWFMTAVWRPIVEAAKFYIALTVAPFVLAWKGIQAAWNGAVSFFSGLWDSVVGAVKTSVNAVVTFFTDLPGWILGALQALPGLAVQGLKDFAYAVGFGIGLAVKEVMAFPGQVVDLLTTLWHDAVSLAESLWNDVVSGWHAMVGAVVGEAEALPGQIASIFTSLWHDVTALVSRLWDDVVSGAKGLVRDAVGVLTDLPGQIGRIFTKLWDDASSVVSTGVDNTLSFFSGLPGRAMDALSSLGDDIKSVCKDAVKWLEQAGEDVINGLVNGIKGAWHKVTDLVGDLGHAVSKGFKDALGISSPSKVFISHGTDTVGGFVLGVVRSQGLAINAVRAMAGGVIGAFNGDGPIGVGAALANAAGGGRTLNYYASGSGLSSEDELFTAAGRARMVW